MSEPNLDDELITDYLAECREHLATIENDLLAIEQAGAAIDEQLVNRVFRAAHSIKGGAGFFDLSRIRELAHRIENVLDLIRSGQMIPTPEVVSILLLAFDKLRELINNYRDSNQAEIGEFVSALTSLTADNLPAHEKASITQRVEVGTDNPKKHIEVSAFDLNQARKGGKFLYLVEYDLIHDIERRGKSPWDVFKCLIRCGTILETLFDLDSAGTLDDEPSNALMLEVLYATVLEPNLLGDLIEAPAERIHLIEKNGSLRPLKKEEAGAVARPASEPAAPAPVTAPVPAPAANPAPAAPASSQPETSVLT